MKYTFHSHFAQDIQAYISLRGSIGYAEYSYDRPLHMFDRFCVTHFPDTTSITQELAEAWCTKKANEKMKTLQRRTVILEKATGQNHPLRSTETFTDEHPLDDDTIRRLYGLC